jgi:hypothetical protein
LNHSGFSLHTRGKKTLNEKEKKHFKGRKTEFFVPSNGGQLKLAHM